MHSLDTPIKVTGSWDETRRTTVALPDIVLRYLRLESAAQEPDMALHLHPFQGLDQVQDVQGRPAQAEGLRREAPEGDGLAPEVRGLAPLPVYANEFVVWLNGDAVAIEFKRR